MSNSICSQASDSSSIRKILTAKIPIKDSSEDRQQRFNHEVASRLRKALLIGGFPILLILGMTRLSTSSYYMEAAPSPPRIEARHEQQQSSNPPLPDTTNSNLRASNSIPENVILANTISPVPTTNNYQQQQQQKESMIVNMTTVEEHEMVSNLSRRRLEAATSMYGYREEGAKPRRLFSNNTTMAEEKPIIYTFYTALHDKKETGMTDQDDELLLQAWKEEWTNHGWEPRVIGMETAEKHPDFASMNSRLLMPHISIYDRYCFLRWLAMATIQDNTKYGGGWMSDYDTFPLHPFNAYPLPNQGRLTVHEYSKNGGVPDLLSGSADEYHRMAMVIINAATAEKQLTSDMFAMHYVYVKNNETYARESNVMPAQVIMRHTKEERICKRTRQKYAIHFSHYAIESMENAVAKDRAAMAQAWLKNWRNKCLNENEPNQQEQQHSTVERV